MLETHPLPSLRARLLRHVLLPVLFCWAIGTALVMGIAQHFVSKAFDRSILDDAYSIASHVGISEGQAKLSISQNEIGNLLFDQADQIFFTVLSQNGEVLASNANLQPQTLPAGASYIFSDAVHHGRSIRSLTLKRTEPVSFTVIVAQTTVSRTEVLRSAAVYALLPQLALFVLLAVWLRRAISRDVQPLHELQRELDRRDTRDLSELTVRSSTRDVQHLGQALNALLQRVSASVRAQREFAGNVAHELRTPLAGIRALASYGLAHDTPQLWREQLQAITKSEERASHMVDQLLALALADETSVGVPLSEVRLDTAVQEAVLRFLPRADALRVDLGAQGIDKPCTVRSNPALIEGILNNLLDNALRYGIGSHGAAQVTVELNHNAEQQVCLSVVDNGAGIAEHVSQELKQRWRQGATARQLQLGAGLGLSIVNEYAQLMGARLELSSALQSLQNTEPRQSTGLRVSVIFPGNDKVTETH